jgi:glycosyltransferase involved in cell wall biosynthesis
VKKRIVHVLHHSPSLLHDEPLAALLERACWHIEVARQQQRYWDDVEVECWTPERRVATAIRREQRGVPNVLFPSYAVGYQRELSPGLFDHLEYNLGRISALFLHGSVSYFSTLLLRRFGRKLPIIVQNHGETSTLGRCADPGVKKPLDYRFRVSLEQGAFSRAQRILCLTSANVADYQRNGVSPSRLRISTMGVDSAMFRPLAEAKYALRRALGLPQTRVLLGFVGRLSGEKRVDRILQLLRELPRDVGLVIVGDGPLRAALAREAAEFGPRVHFAGCVNHGEILNRIYNSLDLLVLPSEREGFPMVVVEALAAGTAVVATDLPGTRALLEDGVCGELSGERGLQDAIRNALERTYRRERLRERALRYSWQSVCEQHAELLREIGKPRARVA